MITQQATSSDGSYGRDAGFEQLLRLAASYAGAEPARSEPSGSELRRRKNAFGEEIAVRAYHLYLNRGAINGHDLDDWLQAEREVIDELKKNRTSLRLALAFGLLKDSSEKNW
jgi:hypothetical protein